MSWFASYLHRLSPRVKTILFAIWVLGATTFLLLVSDLNDHDYVVCDDDHSPTGYCAQLELP